jgi:hypothetical protein
MLPALQIEIGVEEAPRVRIITANEGEEHRIWDWICSQDDLYELVHQAVAIAEERRAA